MATETLAVVPEIPAQVNIAWYTCDRWIEKGWSNRVALGYKEEKISWTALQKNVNKIGNVLRELGVRRADPFLVRSTNCPELYMTILAGMKIGAVPIPTSSLFRSRELAHILRNSGAQTVIVAAELLEALDEAKAHAPHVRNVVTTGSGRPGYSRLEDLLKNASSELTGVETGRDEPAFMLYTSGTTSAPKGVVHAHRWILATGEPNVRDLMELAPDDFCLSVSEICWMYPFGCNFLYPLYAGAAAIVYPERFEPEKAFQYIEKYGVTIFIANPTIYRRMLAIEGAEKRFKTSSLKRCLSSGETLAPETFREWRRRFGCDIYDCMGQTEMHIFCCTRRGVIREGSMGKPLPGINVKVLADDGKQCGPREIGRLAIRDDHPGLFYEYKGMPEVWAEKHKDGWYFTGDIAYVDDDGFYWYVSRSDDLIKSRGYLIGPKEIEDVITENPSVLETAVVGKPDPILGQKIKAFVVLKPSVKPSKELAEELRNGVLKNIAPYKAPKEIAFLESLPKTTTGKILRRELRAQEMQGDTHHF